MRFAVGPMTTVVPPLPVAPAVPVRPPAPVTAVPPAPRGAVPAGAIAAGGSVASRRFRASGRAGTAALASRLIAAVAQEDIGTDARRARERQARRQAPSSNEAPRGKTRRPHGMLIPGQPKTISTQLPLFLIVSQNDP